jgi:hypothetical protein
MAAAPAYLPTLRHSCTHQSSHPQPLPPSGAPHHHYHMSTAAAATVLLHIPSLGLHHTSARSLAPPVFAWVKERRRTCSTEEDDVDGASAATGGEGWSCPAPLAPGWGRAGWTRKCGGGHDGASAAICWGAQEPPNFPSQERCSGRFFLFCSF